MTAYRIALRRPGWGVETTVEAPAAPVPLEAWLPLLQSLADRSAAAAAEAAGREGARVSCACRQIIAISLVEAQALARLVSRLPEPRRSQVRARFAAGLAKVAASGVLEADHAAPSADLPLAETPEQRLGAAWFGLGVACPFLEDEACSIYEARPLVCREHQVTSPAAACARLYREPVDRLEPPTRLPQSLARAAARLAGVPVATIPLLMSLELGPEVDAALARPLAPLAALEALLAEIGDYEIAPA